MELGRLEKHLELFIAVFCKGQSSLVFVCKWHDFFFKMPVEHFEMQTED